MAKSDPTGYEQAIAQIPQGQLSERQQKLAAALAMVESGHTITEASRATGIPRPTIYLHRDGLVSARDGKSKDDEAHRRIFEASQAIALRAADSVLEALESGDMKPGDRVKAYGVAVDKILAFGQQGTSNDDGVSALSQILAGHDVTIHARRPDQDAVDVESVGEGESGEG